MLHARFRPEKAHTVFPRSFSKKDFKQIQQIGKSVNEDNLSQLTVRLLVAGTGTGATKLLWFAATRVGNQERAVVLHQQLLDFLLGGLVNVLLVVGDNGFCNGLADGVQLRDLAAARDAHADVEDGGLVADDAQGLHDLVVQDLRLHQGQGRPVELDEARPFLAVGDGRGSLFAAKRLHLVHLRERELGLF